MRLDPPSPSTPGGVQYRSTGDLYSRISKSHKGGSQIPTPTILDWESDSDSGPDSLGGDHNTADPSIMLTPQSVRCGDVDSLIHTFTGTGNQDQIADITRILNENKYQRLVELLWRLPAEPQYFLVLKSVTDRSSKSLLVSCLDVEYPNTTVVPYARAHWNEAVGLGMVSRFAIRGEIKAIRACLDNNFYASCAFSAAMTYVHDELNIPFCRNSIRVKYSQPAETMGIDRSTIISLELLQNIRSAKAKTSTLFGVLNSTCTPSGRRLLRSTLLQPSTDKKQINERLAAVEELSTHEELFSELRKNLKGLLHIDIEQVTSWIAQSIPQSRAPLEDGLVISEGRHQIVLPSHEELHNAEKDLTSILMLKEYLGGVKKLHYTLKSAECTSALCDWVRQECSPDNVRPIDDVVINNIEKDAIYSKSPIDIRNNRLWAIKAGANSVLEQARKQFRNQVDDLNAYVDSLNKNFEAHLPGGAELYLDNDRHYCLRFQWTDVEREITEGSTAAGSQRMRDPQHLRQCSIAGIAVVNGVRKKKHYLCQTMELLQKSRGIQLQADIVTMQSDKVVVGLREQLIEQAGPLFEMSDAIAMMDMLCAFTQLSTTQDYVRPVISDTLVLKAARHPIMEIRKSNFVSNDVYSGNQGARFQIVTGGNMSGKSTFIKTVALIQILAQMGCFVPARYAAVPICDRLFTRLSTEDKPESNLGTFGVEMREMNLILRQATKDSMVIIDELGRGTSPQDGVAIALAMSERLINTGPRVFFATHFTKIARVLNSSKWSGSVLNVHLEGQSRTDGDTRQITLPHTIAGGPVKNEDYGIDLARRFFAPRLIRNAEKITQFLREKDSHKRSGPATRVLKQSKLVLAMPDLLKQARDSSMDDSALASYLKRLQIEFTVRMNKVAEDEDIEEQNGDERSAHSPTVPVLEKPDDEEFEAWKKRFDVEEKRVMQINASYTSNRKRPSPDLEREAARKRSKTYDSYMESVSQPLRINRGKLITKQRKAKHSAREFKADGMDDTGSISEPIGESEFEGLQMGLRIANSCEPKDNSHNSYASANGRIEEFARIYSDSTEESLSSSPQPASFQQQHSSGNDTSQQGISDGLHGVKEPNATQQSYRAIPRPTDPGHAFNTSPRVAEMASASKYTVGIPKDTCIVSNDVDSRNDQKADIGTDDSDTGLSEGQTMISLLPDSSDEEPTEYLEGGDESASSKDGSSGTPTAESSNYVSRLDSDRGEPADATSEPQGD
ncbi:muts domain V-domain-containing protein [Lasiosphaeria hispida]|uniref:DNA mismatch repair protein MSH3 n=1 Tax=Lasiosphaeria hispida TaxID=260671 RepID=A0AAJ0HTK8_9PEZI|nr:muts domain V-domain-containing protein [Lasiosphaeria hispida]